jgi:hypothetical protein
VRCGQDIIRSCAVNAAQDVFEDVYALVPNDWDETFCVVTGDAVLYRLPFLVQNRITCGHVNKKCLVPIREASIIKNRGEKRGGGPIAG